MYVTVLNSVRGRVTPYTWTKVRLITLLQGKSENFRVQLSQLTGVTRHNRAHLRTIRAWYSITGDQSQASQYAEL